MRAQLGERGHPHLHGDHLEQPGLLVEERYRRLPPGLKGCGHREVGELYMEEIVVVSKVTEGGSGEVRVVTHELQDVVAELG